MPLSVFYPGRIDGHLSGVHAHRAGGILLCPYRGELGGTGRRHGAYNRNMNNTASKAANVGGAVAGASTGNVAGVLLKK